LLGDAYPVGNASTTSEEKLRALVPVGRRAAPEEVAAAAVFLASDEASYINGVSLAIDGGWVAA
jgi:NAD(P)-dependent dehydrogenase (short-subunit alcohol dehydrogenase family)